MRYIDAEKIVITAERGICDDGLLFIPMIDAHRSIDATPTADVVEVVRCKDCKRRQIDNFGRIVCVRNQQMIEIKDSDYCSYGERREE